MINIVKGRFKPGLLATFILIHGIAVWGLWESRHGVPMSVMILAFVLYCARGLGITVGYHRYWTHRAFKCNRPVQVFLAIAGALAVEQSIVQWRSWHRQHHAFTDKGWDPHSPLAYIHLRYPYNRIVGFLWSHIGWMLWETVAAPQFVLPTLADQDWVVRWQNRLYWPIAIGLGFVLPYLLFGMPGLYWCGFIGVVGFLHITWCVNSVCHMWGKRAVSPNGWPYVADLSRNNTAVALLGFGEGWHANHHDSQSSADLGREHWFDPGRWLIRAFERCGWAWDVRGYQ